MKETLESKAAPKHEELIAEFRINSELTRLNGLKLDRIIEQRGEQKDMHSEWLEQWGLQKTKATRITWIQVFIGVAALTVAVYSLNSFSIDEKSQVIMMITDVAKTILGVE